MPMREMPFWASFRVLYPSRSAQKKPVTGQWKFGNFRNNSLVRSQLRNSCIAETGKVADPTVTASMSPTVTASTTHHDSTVGGIRNGTVRNSGTGPDGAHAIHKDPPVEQILRNSWSGAAMASLSDDEENKAGKGKERKVVVRKLAPHTQERDWPIPATIHPIP
jgi:hypothetical protein